MSPEIPPFLPSFVSQTGIERVLSLKGRVMISHGFTMKSLSEFEAADIATRMAELEMSLASTLPFGGSVMPMPIMLEKKREGLTRLGQLYR